MSVVDKCSKGKFNKLIYDSPGYCEALHIFENKTIEVALIFNKKEGVDETILYTFDKDDVGVGDYIQRNDNYYLPYDLIKSVLSEGVIRTYQARECNAFVEVKGETEEEDVKIPCVYYGTYTTPINSLSSDGNNHLTNKTTLIISSFYKENLNFIIGKEVVVNDRTWRITEIDDSKKGIVYATVINVHNTGLRAEVIEEEEFNEDIAAGVKYKLSTEQGYFESYPTVEVIERLEKEVEFKFPFGVKQFTIKTKNKGRVEEQTFTIGE